jgi:hypothetical protein
MTIAPLPSRLNAAHEPSQAGLDIDAIEHDVKILSRHSKLDHVTRLHLTRTPHRGLDLLSIAGRNARGRRGTCLSC